MSPKKRELTVEIKDGVLNLSIPINEKPERSGSGKTLVVASSRGNKKTSALVNGQEVYVGFNAYVYPDEK